MAFDAVSLCDRQQSQVQGGTLRALAIGGGAWQMELVPQLGNNYALQRDLLFYCTIPSPYLVLESRCVMALHRPCVGGSKTGKL